MVFASALAMMRLANGSRGRKHDGHPLSGDGHPLSGDGHPLSGNGHPLSGNGHPLSGDGHPLSGNGHPLSGDGTRSPAMGTRSPTTGLVLRRNAPVFRRQSSRSGNGETHSYGTSLHVHVFGKRADAGSPRDRSNRSRRVRHWNLRAFRTNGTTVAPLYASPVHECVAARDDRAGNHWGKCRAYEGYVKE